LRETPTYADVIVIGGGAAGLFFAAEAGQRGQSAIIIDHAEKIGEKIRISGGGRCNFTNLHTTPENFLSSNPKFAISALRGFTPKDFIARVNAAGIAWHEKKLGQLFCDESAHQIIDLLVDGCHQAGVTLQRGTQVHGVAHRGGRFEVETSIGVMIAPKLVIATGGKSIPKIGATGWGYQLAEQFGLAVIEPRPALVPLTFEGTIKDMAVSLAGVSVEASVTAKPAPERARRAAKAAFTDGFLFTHRGLSGPSILQISSYWREGEAICIDLSPGNELRDRLREARAENGRMAIHTALGAFLPKRLAMEICALEGYEGAIGGWSDRRLAALAERLHNWSVNPAGSEGYRTAEVTLGGVDTAALHSSTMEVKSVPGLYFIGEVVDVTGWLGGYNFQWAWASAYAAAKAVSDGKGKTR
jgi:predicted Rossmann fold flavoprotein